MVVVKIVELNKQHCFISSSSSLKSFHTKTMLD